LPFAVRRPSIVPRLSSTPRSAVRGPHSFIRSPFVDGLPPPPDRLESLPYGSLPSAVHPAVCRPRSSFVYSFPIRWRSSLRQAGKPPPPPSTVYPPPSIPRSAVCGPPSAFVYSFPIRWRSSLPQQAGKPPYLRPSRGLPFAVLIRLFVPYSLTVRLPRQAGKPALPPSIPRSAVRRLHSFIRSPFVDGLLLPWQAGKPVLRRPAVLRPSRGLPSAVCIRLFVPHSLTVFPPPTSWKACATG